MRKFRKIALYILGIFFTLIFSLIVLAYVYQEEIKQYAITYLNQYLQTEVHVEKIEFSFIQRFPYATLKFENVTVYEPNKTDTLMQTDVMYMEFNFWDIINGDYNVQRIETGNTLMHLKVFENGSDNFTFLKPSEDTVSSPFKFDLKNVFLQEIDLTYDNYIHDQHYDLTGEQLSFNGDFSNTDYNMEAKGEIYFHSFVTGQINWFQEKQGAIDVQMHVQKDSMQFDIQKGVFNIEDLSFDISGDIQALEETNLNLSVNGNQLPLQSVYSIFPKSFVGAIKEYTAEGILNFQSTIQGIATNAHPPLVEATYNLENASMVEPTNKVALKEIELNGTFTNRNNKGDQEINLKNFAAKFIDGHFSGSMVLSDFSSPKIATNFKADLNLNTLFNFLQPKEIKTLSGQTIIRGNVKTHLVKKKNGESYYKIDKASGNINLKNTKLQIKDDHIIYSDLDGTLILNNNKAAIDQLSGFVQNSAFTLDGYFDNIISYFIDNQPMNIVAELRSNKILLDEIITSSGGESTGADNVDDPFYFPDKINLEFKTNIKELVYDNFTAEKVRGFIELKDMVLFVKNLQLNSAEGKIKLSGEMDGTKDGFAINTKVNLDKVDVSKLFQSLNNFQQTYITSEHLKGKANMNVDLGLFMNNNLEIDPATIIAFADFDIRKGELINNQSMIDIAQYLRETKVVNKVIDVNRFEKDVSHIKFGRLTNKIEIKNQCITIPEMEIKSSAMNINISGKHWFNDSIDYHFDFRLNQLFVDKSNDDFGPIIDDGSGYRLYLKMFGTVDVPQFKMDKEKRKEELKENIQQEKQDVKAILKEEFGLFNKDTTVGTYQEEKKAKPQFEIEWDEFEDVEEEDVDDLNESEEEPRKKPKKKDKNKGIRKLINQLEDVDEKETETIIEIE